MGQQNVPLYALNRGEVSKLALARVDIDRLRLSAETQLNVMPRTPGPAMLRPGTAQVTEVYNSAPCRYLPFVFGARDTALIELTDSIVRVLVDETPITRASVATTVPAFSTWTSTGSTGATITKASTIDISGNLASLASSISRALTIAGGDQATEHGLRIVIAEGPITFRIGTAPGLDDIFASSGLGVGTHSFAFTPNTGTVYLEFESSAYARRRVTSVAIEAAGVMTLPSPYLLADLASIAHESSADTLFLCGASKQQRKIERRGVHSYSIVLYEADDGPFAATSGDSSVLITPSALIGNITLTANKAAFKSTHVGALIRLFHLGQDTVRSLAASDTFSDVIRIAGVSKITVGGTTTTTKTEDRNFRVTIAGTWAGTLTLQRSLEGPTTGFTDYDDYVGNITNELIEDSLDNIIAWYRLGFKTGEYTSGTANVSISYSGGGAAGIARITAYTSATLASAEVLQPFVAVAAATDWRLQEWSNAAGFPSAVAIFDGRLWFAGQTRIWGSVSDAYTSFDLDKEGDAGTINRSIGRGPVQNINWLLPLSRLMLGGDSSIITARSTSFDEPLTPTIFSLKDSLTIAASSLAAVKVDMAGIFVSGSGRKAYETQYDVQKTDFNAADLTRLNPDIGLPGFVDVAVQREPDTRIHFVLGDGQVAVLLYDKADQVEAWWRFETDGTVENVVVLPGDLESRVFYVVNRTIDGVTKRYLEKWARIDECEGGTINKLADCHALYSGAPTTTITGLDYLEGEGVVVWADGYEVGLDPDAPSDPAIYYVTGGSITLPAAVSEAVVGLPYTGRFKSAKLAYAAEGGTALNQVKRVESIGLQLQNTHALGLRYGPDFDTLDDLPLVEAGASHGVNAIWEAYDETTISFPGSYDTDSRICLEMQAPRPCTVLAIAIGMKTAG